MVTIRPLIVLIILYSLNTIKVVWSSTSFKEEYKTGHLRWQIHIHKDDIELHKNKNSFQLRLSNLTKYNNLIQQIQANSNAEDYIQNIIYDKSKFPADKLFINTYLKKNIELFSFYRNKEELLVIDLWLEDNQEVSSSKVHNLNKSNVQVTKINKTKKVKEKSQSKLEKNNNSKKTARSKRNKYNKEIRDYRYGANIIWNYSPYIPNFKSQLDVNNKTVEYLFSSDILLDEENSYQKLIYKLYKEKKYGLMSKSISIYEKDNGNIQSEAFVFFEYLKANSMLRLNMDEKQRAINKSALTILENIIELSTNYDLKKSIYIYLIETKKKEKNNIESLKLSKRLFLLARKDFDKQIERLAIEYILHDLSMMGQLDKLSDFIHDPISGSITNQQLYFSYQSYLFLRKKKAKQLIKEFEKQYKGIKEELLPTILFNVAEAYFQVSDYDQSLKYFDQFAKLYSYDKHASKALIRLALIYDLKNENFEKVKKLYIRAMNKASTLKTRIESKLRYVGHAYNRVVDTKKQNEEDLLFMQLEEQEKKHIDDNLKNLMWHVRLRSFLAQKKYKNALIYFNTLDVNGINPKWKNIYELDASEIIFGLSHQYYKTGQYSKVVKQWEYFRNSFLKRSAFDPHYLSLVSNSYLRLNLIENINDLIELVKNNKDFPTKEYPLWIDRRKLKIEKINYNELVLEKYIREKNYDLANSFMNQIHKNKLKFYKAKLNFLKGNYKEANSIISEIILDANQRSLLSDEKQVDLNYMFVMGHYFIGSESKFITLANAYLKDIQVKEIFQKSNETESIRYYLTETEYRYNKNYDLVRDLVSGVVTHFPNSTYLPRLNYILANIDLEENKLSLAKEKLEELIKNESTPDYLREMAKTDLTSMMLQNYSI